MANWTHFYLIHIEFLGFRYHGWQKQPDRKSIHGQIDKTMIHILGHKDFRTLGCGRTDAKVSADDYGFELFVNDKLDTNELLFNLNKNLPTDIRAKSVKVVDASFNVIQNAKVKEYHYHFYSGNKFHPFNAPFIYDFGEKLDVEKMKEASKLYEGTHNFKNFVAKPSPDTIFEREILFSSIEECSKYSGSFSPKEVYVFKVSSKGFMRYQVRLMMGALVEIGRGTWSIKDLKEKLENIQGENVKNVAPSSGLVLHKVIFED